MSPAITAGRRGVDVTLHCAGRLGADAVPVLRVVAAAELNDLPLEGSRDLYQREARLLADALLETLPGGTIDQLLIALLEQRASYLRVRL